MWPVLFNKNDENAQVGLEYLMTYGWVLVIVASVLGVLVFIMNPPSAEAVFSSSNPEKMLLKGSMIDPTGSADIVLQNVSGGAISVESAYFFGDLGAADGWLLNGVAPANFPVSVPAGQNLSFEGIVSRNNCQDGGTVAVFYRDFANFDRRIDVSCNGGAKMPVAWYRLDSIDGSIAEDSAGENNGLVFGSPVISSDCPSDACIQFNGSTQYINCGNEPPIQITGDMTLVYWAKPANVASARQNPLCKSYGAEFCLTMEQSGQLSYYHGSAGGNAQPYLGFYSSGMFINDTWVHVAITRDVSGRRMKSYKNGSYKSTATWTSNRDPSVSLAYNLQIGAGYVSRFNGFMDEVLIFNRTLSDFEICSLCHEHDPTGSTCNC